ncbi:outer membrane protein assembly factor BamB family protein [Halococcus hamelinensis]|uniref:Pyrrolo-quinoline quinone repeat domain-containing protein n=1 Tax=Halococcus hamelinensis 100A6 TaxID=1132509 RepID=M0LWN9_9EURY|nr:FG-GAP-like repeat-containing protein [Halococcus hamelinensis]EMA37563.1 hypothetical protein C447_12617 [Halococcus hamelinensis 100A6]
MQVRTGLVAAVVVVALAGAAVVGYDTVTASSGTLTEEWVSDTPRPNQVNHHPVAAVRTGGQTFIAAPVSSVAGTPDAKCALVMLDSTGTTDWERTIRNRSCATHGIGDPTIADFDGNGELDVLIPTTENVLYGYDANDGTETLRFDLTSFGYSAPAVFAEPVRETVVADFDGSVFAVRPNETVAWQDQVAAGVTADTKKADFDGDGGPEVAVSAPGNVTLYEPNGTLVWERSVYAAFAVSGSVEGEQTLFVATGDGVVALDGTTGATEWRWNTSNNRPAIHALGDGDGDGAKEIYVTTGGGNLDALSARTGEVEWHADLSTEDSVAPPPDLGDLDGDGEPELVTVTNSGAVSVRDPANGNRLASYERDVAVWTHPTLVDLDGDGTEEVLVMYGDGRVVALSYDS